VEEHIEYYIRGTDADLTRAPANFTSVKGNGVEAVLAHGRDPFFSGWTDTLQLDYGNAPTQEAMLGELLKIARQCDGVRCDMAMLVLPEIFQRTWGKPAQPFWPGAIQRVRQENPEFCFMAEVYWDLEWTLQQQGFDYAYDKRLYDRLREGHAWLVRDHLKAGLEYQKNLARFLENHDEPRAAAVFPRDMHRAAAVVTFLAPGLRFFHQGQFEGRMKRISAHLCRAPEETVNVPIREFYERLLEILRGPVVRNGQWQLLECIPAWNGNASSNAFVAYSWQNAKGERLLVAVNYAAHQSQCYIRLPFFGLDGERWRLRDLLGNAEYERDGTELKSRGFYLDVPAWQCHVFEMKAA
jgi:hypothetical protein